MALELISAKYAVKDAEGNPIKDAEGKNVYAEVSANYDFGDNLDAIIAKCGKEATFGDAVANQKVKFQSFLRSLHMKNPDPEFIQTEATKWVSGVTAPRVAVDPVQATLSQFASWPKEKQREFLKQLQGK